MNNLDGKDLLPDASALDLRGIQQDSNSWVVEAHAPAIAACPDCGASSTARHSSYWRRLKDLPIQGRSVRLKLRVGRGRCHNPTCKRKIFCQRLPSVTGKHAQETNRFTEILQSVGYALGGRAGKRLGVRLGLRIGGDTLLRRVKRAARSRPQSTPIPVVGVDEWAWRKGYSGYGTMLVDLERGIVADLLPDRSAAAFEKWLREHPEVRVISRDRDSVYAEGGYGGAPRAEQVADRFHLVQKLIKAVQTELEHRRHYLLIPATEFLRKDTIEAPVPSRQRWGRPNPRQKEIRRQRRQQKEELFRMVKGMQAQGMRAFEIVKVAGISRGRVDKWLRLAECPPQNKMAPRSGMPEAFREELRRLWDQGRQNGRKLLEEVRKLGYIGSYSGLVSLVSEWREEKRGAEKAAVPAACPSTEQTRPAVTPMRHVSPQEAAALLSKPKPMLNERQREAVAYLDQRGLRSPKLIEHMRIGYAPGGCLRGWLTQLGYSPESLRQNGLVTANGYDTYMHRVVVPLESNLYGRSISASAPPHRFLPGARGGLYAWKQARQYPEVILVEGLFDYATLWQAGFHNVTCSMGNHLTAHQYWQLCDHPRTVYVAFDADRNGSGQQAAQTLACRLKEYGVDVRTVALPDGHDPSSFFLRDGDARQFQSLLESAQ